MRTTTTVFNLRELTPNHHPKNSCFEATKAFFSMFCPLWLTWLVFIRWNNLFDQVRHWVVTMVVGYMSLLGYGLWAMGYGYG